MTCSKADFLAGATLAAAGVVLGVSSLSIRSPVPQQAGPWLAPFAASGILLAVSVLLMRLAFLGGWSEVARHIGGDSTGRAWWVFAGMLANVLLITPAGFVPASTILFVVIGRAAGSRSLLRDILLGLILAVLCELVFTHLLGLSLGDSSLGLR